MFKTKLCVLFVLLVSLQLAYAYDFTIDSISSPVTMPYQGETVELTSSITMDSNNVCKLTCNWKTEGHDGNIGEELVGWQTKNFGFRVEAKGIFGHVSTPLIVNCVGRQAWNCYPWPTSPPTETRTKLINFDFGYNGDGICTTRNNYESCISAKDDCSCGLHKSCINDKGDSKREVDEHKCATYCGNGVTEKQYETCSSCPIDVGKCDGEFCNEADECEGDYCVHKACSHSPFIKNDGFCDAEVGENCRNSAKDCACESYERCSSTGVCETYCGNGICEVEEQGVCAEDCDWCGDGTCQPGETCRGCPLDCGECKRTEDEERIKELAEIKKEAREAWKIRAFMNTLAFGTLGLAFLILIGWIVYRVIKAKKLKQKPKKNFIICKKCKTKNLLSAKFCHKCGKGLKPKKKKKK